MADKKISALTAATTPLAGTEVLPIVQSGSTVKVSVNNLTVGKPVSVGSLASAGSINVADNFSVNWGNGNSYITGNGAGFGLSAYVAATKIWSIDGSGATTFDFPVNLNNVNLVIGTAGKGIDFSANPNPPGMTSELLNDYEEGTWTATISDGTTDATMNAGRRVGTYTKVGRQVTVTNYIATTSMTGVTGNLRIKGLPFTVGNSPTVGGAIGYCDSSMVFTLGQSMVLQTASGVDYIVIRYWNGAAGTPNMTGAQWGAVGEIGFTLTYFV
jgi:hypothetical protein